MSALLEATRWRDAAATLLEIAILDISQWAIEELVGLDEMVAAAEAAIEEQLATEDYLRGSYDIGGEGG